MCKMPVATYNFNLLSVSPCQGRGSEWGSCKQTKQNLHKFNKNEKRKMN